jgi:hypothetical protein
MSRRSDRDLRVSPEQLASGWDCRGDTKGKQTQTDLAPAHIVELLGKQEPGAKAECASGCGDEGGTSALRVPDNTQVISSSFGNIGAAPDLLRHV